VLLRVSPFLRPDIYKGDRRGVKPLDSVRLNLGTVPSKATSVLQAVRLGLEIENDVRVATDRINKLKLPIYTSQRPLPLMPITQLAEKDPTRSPSVIELEEEEETVAGQAEDKLKGMPLL
jgi:hypothetical protein